LERHSGHIVPLDLVVESGAVTANGSGPLA